MQQDIRPTIRLLDIVSGMPFATNSSDAHPLTQAVYYGNERKLDMLSQFDNGNPQTKPIILMEYPSHTIVIHFNQAAQAIALANRDAPSRNKDRDRFYGREKYQNDQR